MIKDLAWQPSTIDSAHLAMLRAERHKTKERGFPELSPSDQRIIDISNLDNPNENARLRFLVYQGIGRGPIFMNLPPDTKWFDVRFIEREHLAELHAIRDSGWNSPEDRNELLRVAKRHPVNPPLQTPPSKWPPPILWGHSKDGPFTILEGNNRFTGYLQLPSPPELKIAVLIGLSPKSPNPCVWHRLDFP